MPRNLREERERARRLATGIVSWAIMLVGGMFLVLAVVVGLQRDAGLLVLAFILAVIGLFAIVGGFFFHLVPSRVDDLEQAKRDYDARQAEAAAEGRTPGNGDGRAPEE